MGYSLNILIFPHFVEKVTPTPFCRGDNFIIFKTNSKFSYFSFLCFVFLIFYEGIFIPLMFKPRGKQKKRCFNKDTKPILRSNRHRNSCP